MTDYQIYIIDAYIEEDLRSASTISKTYRQMNGTKKGSIGPETHWAKKALKASAMMVRF